MLFGLLVSRPIATGMLGLLTLDCCSTEAMISQTDPLLVEFKAGTWKQVCSEGVHTSGSSPASAIAYPSTSGTITRAHIRASLLYTYYDL